MAHLAGNCCWGCAGSIPSIRRHGPRWGRHYRPTDSSPQKRNNPQAKPVLRYKSMIFVATKQHVLNRGTASDDFLSQLIAWGKIASDDIFSPNSASDVYSSVYTYWDLGKKRHIGDA